MIAWTIYITFAGAFGLLFMPRFFARWIALGYGPRRLRDESLAFFDAHDAGNFATIVRIPWVPALGMEYHLAADGISLTLALVTGLTAVSAVLFSWDVEHRPNEFFLLAAPRHRRVVWRLPQRRFVLALRLLRAGDRAEIFPHRDLGIDQQGIRRHEVDALFVPGRRACFPRHRRRVCHRRLARSSPTLAIQIPSAISVVGVSR